jgi:hypothetical protein
LGLLSEERRELLMSRRNVNIPVQIHTDGPRPVCEESAKSERKCLVRDGPPALLTDILLGDRDERNP